MTIEEVNMDVDHWELDQCRYCKGPIEDPTETYCSATCELKWVGRHDEQADNSLASSSVFSAHINNSIQSTPRSTPLSSASSSPELGPILPSNSMPILSLESLPTSNDQRRSSIYRTHKYGSSHNPIKKSFPSNYYQSTVGDRSSAQYVFAEKSVSLGIRKTIAVDTNTKTTDRSEKQTSPVNKKELPTPTGSNRRLWSWRRLSTIT